MIPLPPLYVLPHGIKVVGEYRPSARVPYWRVRIRPHEFFDAPIIRNGMYVRRSRVVAASMLGRKLSVDEHVHHRNGDKTDDRPENLEVLHKFEHLSHHKAGAKHSEAAKARIGSGLRRAYQDGRRNKPAPRARCPKTGCYLPDLEPAT